MSQSTSHILMLRPAAFGYNEQTAGSNAFQNNAPLDQAAAKALQEFDAFVDLLKSHGIDAIVVNDTEQPAKPDAVFPNNWVTFHETGDVLLYPMQAENRRFERREDIVRQLEDRFQVNHIIDLSRFELQNKFLEGTGSMVLDRENKIAYACLSPRTNAEVLQSFCDYTGYTSVTFHATDAQQQAIYHTNVMMCVGSGYAIVGLDSIVDTTEKEQLTRSLQNTGKEIIEVSQQQLQRFAGNMLEVQNCDGEKFLVLSKSAYESLLPEQITAIRKYAKPLYADLHTIETIGGGSARCMLAEVHLPEL